MVAMVISSSSAAADSKLCNDVVRHVGHLDRDHSKRNKETLRKAAHAVLLHHDRREQRDFRVSNGQFLFLSNLVKNRDTQPSEGYRCLKSSNTHMVYALKRISSSRLGSSRPIH